MKKALILINKISEEPTEDELDVLDQAAVIEEALKELGYDTFKQFLDLDFQEAKEMILALKPDIAFNLVESVDNKAELIFLPTAFLESINIPYTGCRLHSMYLTSNKVLAKERMSLLGLSTAQWFSPSELEKLAPDKRYIIKPLWEDASVDIDDHVVFRGSDKGLSNYFIKNPKKKAFVEEYIDGREFNISVLGGNSGPEVLPPAEIIFIDYPDDKPKIVGYRSKWDEDSFEYKNSVRSFEFNNQDEPLLNELRAICVECWNGFGLKGYARVDFRVDPNGRPFILEINANPCISPDAGFYAAARKAGYKFTEVVNRIIEDAYKL
jgi:D-alanine-D-alanine ligase